MKIPPYRFPTQTRTSVLFITLDSCRFDTFDSALVPNLSAVGETFRALAPGNFTYGSHMAMFMGFTPGVPDRQHSYINPKYGKLFRMRHGGIEGRGRDHITLDGRNIMDGFRRRGYRAIGSGAVAWFNPATDTASNLIEDFEAFFYPGSTYALEPQLQWIATELSKTDQDVFLFLNIGETHVPYYFDGAPWSAEENPCVPFSEENDAGKCRLRQRLALEYVDKKLGPLLQAFQAGTTLICADHGDCWGEDGLWEHGISHQKVLEVPLIYRIPER